MSNKDSSGQQMQAEQPNEPRLTIDKSSHRGHTGLGDAGLGDPNYVMFEDGDPKFQRRTRKDIATL